MLLQTVRGRTKIRHFQRTAKTNETVEYKKETVNLSSLSPIRFKFRYLFKYELRVSDHFVFKEDLHMVGALHHFFFLIALFPVQLKIHA